MTTPSRPWAAASCWSPSRPLRAGYAGGPAASLDRAGSNSPRPATRRPRPGRLSTAASTAACNWGKPLSTSMRCCIRPATGSPARLPSAPASRTSWAREGSQLSYEWSLIPDKGRGTGALETAALTNEAGAQAPRIPVGRRVPHAAVLIRAGPAHFLDGAPPCFPLQPPLLGGAAGFGWPARSWRHGGAADQCDQPV